MATPDNDDLAVGEALIEELASVADTTESYDAVSGVWKCGESLSAAGRSDDALQLYDRLLAWFHEHDRAESAEQIAYTMLERAAALRSLDRLPESVAQYDDLIRRCRTDWSPSPTLQDYMANALSWKGYSLLLLKRWLEALVSCDELIALDATLPRESRDWVINARNNRGTALEGLGDKVGAADAFAAALSALPTGDDPVYQRASQEMRIRRGRILADLGETAEACALFDSLIAIADPASPEDIAAAYYEKAYYLAKGGELEAAIDVAEASVQRFGPADDPRVRIYAAGCLQTKISALKRLGRDTAAALTADQLVERFGADLDPGIEKIVARHAHRLGRSRSRLRFRGLG